MNQQNEMSARALTMEKLENVNGGIPSLMRQILKKNGQTMKLRPSNPLLLLKQ